MAPASVETGLPSLGEGGYDGQNPYTDSCLAEAQKDPGCAKF